MKEIRIKMIAAINDWKQSGMSVNQYCQLHNLNRSVFYYWRKKMFDSIEGAPSSSFQLIDIPMTVGSIEYFHPAGHKIIFHHQVDALFLKSLIS